MTKQLLIVAVLLVIGAPVHAGAQRISSSIVSPQLLRPSVTASHSTADYLPQHHDSTTADTSASNVAAWGALGGTILGAAVGYRVGLLCTEERNAGPCERTATIGGAVVGALIGYALGSIIDMGNAHDRARRKE